MTITYDMEQGSRDWFLARRGKPTASCFSKIISPAKLKPSTQAEGYMHQLLAERFSEVPAEDEYVSPLMQRGNDLEPHAANYYALTRGVELEVVGFATTDDGLVGASVDRLVGAKGILEIKCPGGKKHVTNALTAAGIGSEYRLQQQGQLWVCERDWCDGLSYHPDMPDATVRTHRDEAVIRALQIALDRFLEEMNDKHEELLRMGFRPTTYAAPTPREAAA